MNEDNISKNNHINDRNNGNTLNDMINHHHDDKDDAVVDCHDDDDNQHNGDDSDQVECHDDVNPDIDTQGKLR